MWGAREECVTQEAALLCASLVVVAVVEHWLVKGAACGLVVVEGGLHRHLHLHLPDFANSGIVYLAEQAVNPQRLVKFDGCWIFSSS